MKRRDIVIGLLLLLLAAAGIYFILKDRDNPEIVIEPTPTPISVEDMESKFNIDIPDNAETAELTGDGVSALASRETSENGSTISILADLPDPETGVYQAWVEKGEEGQDDFDRVSLGNLRMAKGGYLLEYSGTKDLTDYKKVTVSRETLQDSTIEDIVLQGNF